MHSTMKCLPHLSLLAAAAGLALAASPAMAQGYAYGAPAYGPTEEVIVTAPPILRGEGGNLDVPGRASMSIPVRYDDLDLATGSGARALRHRVRLAARDVCAQLAAAYPVHQLNGTSCIRDAMNNGLVRADAAIHDARLSYYYDYYED